jgi:DNA-binding transcriptional MerR regulator
VINQTSGYNLKVVMHETGLSAEILHAWERRYGLPKPDRTPGGHRLYTRHDIQMLNWLSDRLKEGMNISRAVDNWRSLEAAGQDPLVMYLPQPHPVEIGGAVLDEYCQAWVNACQDFNEQAAEQVLSQAFGLFAPEIVCVNLIQKGISMIGGDWYTGKTSVQQEHFASALAMRRLYSLFAAAPAPTRPGRILAACPAGEQHEFGLLLLVLLLRRRGWDVVYLGADVPILRLESTLQAAKPFLVVSVAQTLPSAASLRKMGEFLASRDLGMAYAGGIINDQPTMQDFIPGFYLGRAFPEAIQTVESLWNLKPTNPIAHPVPPNYQQALKHYIELQPKIEIFLTEGMQADEILPAHLDIALTTLRRHVEAALELGEIRFVENTFDWLKGLLVNHGLSIEFLKRFLDVYQQALETHLPVADQAVFASLIENFKDYSDQSLQNEFSRRT